MLNHFWKNLASIFEASLDGAIVWIPEAPRASRFGEDVGSSFSRVLKFRIDFRRLLSQSSGSISLRARVAAGARKMEPLGRSQEQRRPKIEHETQSNTRFSIF